MAGVRKKPYVHSLIYAQSRDPPPIEHDIPVDLEQISVATEVRHHVYIPDLVVQGITCYRGSEWHERVEGNRVGSRYRNPCSYGRPDEYA